mmetsp:Transcript_11989/g.31724  ORF Transcript_11989/g.31724 Transcript_11989/m.31724 type:complete len:364 (-) Transcript_11989:1883-2974(-)
MMRSTSSPYTRRNTFRMYSIGEVAGTLVVVSAGVKGVPSSSALTSSCLAIVNPIRRKTCAGSTLCTRMTYCCAFTATDTAGCTVTPSSPTANVFTRCRSRTLGTRRNIFALRMSLSPPLNRSSSASISSLSRVVRRVIAAEGVDERPLGCADDDGGGTTPGAVIVVVVVRLLVMVCSQGSTAPPVGFARISTTPSPSSSMSSSRRLANELLSLSISSMSESPSSSRLLFFSSSATVMGSNVVLAVCSGVEDGDTLFVSSSPSSGIGSAAVGAVGRGVFGCTRVRSSSSAAMCLIALKIVLAECFKPEISSCDCLSTASPMTCVVSRMLAVSGGAAAALPSSSSTTPSAVPSFVVTVLVAEAHV